MATMLLLDAGDTRLRIALDADRAPRTAAALLASLPAEIDLHCAKIAGNHILWHAPFVVDAEATQVLNDQLILYVWYDNEYGYSCQVMRMLEHVIGVSRPLFP